MDALNDFPILQQRNGLARGSSMNRLCRKLRASSLRRPGLAALALRHAKVVTDPRRLAQLKAEVANRKRKEEADRQEHSTMVRIPLP